MTRNDRSASRSKPTIEQLGVDLAALEWQRSGASDGSLEVAFVRGDAGNVAGAPARPGGAATSNERAGAGADWVLLRVAGDITGRVLVYDRIEWISFLDGVRNGEFDPGASCDGSGTAGGPVSN
jgi:hypothetical protein